jgi:hypothetical protein
MPAQIYERSDVSKANHRYEGWTLYGGVESWQGFPREKCSPSTGKRAEQILWRAGEPTA